MDARWWMMWHCPWWTCEQPSLLALISVTCYKPLSDHPHTVDL